ncbi:tetratricopeptide repeat protein [Haloferula sargassicola]|uniref:Lipopolysaccharide assembly protein B n=1 Tax=Haloferula sargassicola TaxID=490096 RepID=A0ABP9UTN9_9BACT
MKSLPCLLLLASLAGSGSAHEAEAPPEVTRLQERIGSRDPTAEDWLQIGEAWMQHARNTLDHDFSEAREAYGEALELAPDDERALAGMAWVANSEHRFDEGAEWAHKAIDRDPRCVFAYALLGDGEMELGEYDAAFDHFQQALDLRADLSTLSRGAHLLWLTGDTNRAMALMRQAIDAGGRVPENEAWCRAELALMQFKTGATKAAVQQGAKALELAPDNPRVLMIMGMIRAAGGNDDEARSLYEHSVEVNPTHEPLVGLVELAKRRGDDGAVKKWTSRVLAFHQHSHGHAEHHHHGVDHHVGSAQLALFMADQDMDAGKALAEGKLAYEQFPNIHAADAYAWCAYKSGDLKLAKRMIRRAMKFGTAEPRFHYHAGMIAAASGDVSGARKQLMQALDLNPDFDPIEAPKAREELERLRATVH